MHKILINGAWVDALIETSREIKNPATLKSLGTVPDCGPADVARAVAAAKAAQPGWWKIPGVEKAKLLREIGARIRAREHALASLMTQETGKPLCEAVDCIDWVAACFEYYGEVARSSYGNSVPPVAPHQLNFTIKEPFGVVAAIVPFNFPLLLMAWKVAPAIAAGNTVICKPPHQNPLSNLKLAEVYDLLPPGVVNVVTGAAETGTALVEHPDVDLIAFTGSTAVGRKIAAAAGAQLKKVNLELGSIDPFIVFKDADLDVAVPGVAWARLLNSGQVCTSSKRIYVEQPIAAEFSERMQEYVARLEVGDPIAPDTDLGPLISHRGGAAGRGPGCARVEGRRHPQARRRNLSAGRTARTLLPADTPDQRAPRQRRDARGDLRARAVDHDGGRRRRGDPARERLRVRARRLDLHQGPRDRDAGDGVDQGRHLLDQRSADRQ